MNIKIKRSISSGSGVYGNSLVCKGEHSLQVGGFGEQQLAEIAFSVWVRPSGLSGNREIFRQETPNRLLFSFQGDGSILSLGLTIGTVCQTATNCGYIECDGNIERDRLMDGAWHHCAGTFDGTTMRVYLDGAVAGSLDRPGKIALDPNGPAFIGSISGTGEHYQGRLDDLRIYSKALTPEEVAALYRNGTDALADFNKRMDEEANSIYTKSDSFSSTLVETRRKVVQRAPSLEDDLADAVLRKLKTDFPEESAFFFEYTDGSAFDYLCARDNSFNEKQGQRLVELLLEYKPLTEYQCSKQTPEQRQQWDEADRMRQVYEQLKARGMEGSFAPEWVDLMLDAGRRIQFRPHVNEPVAPYVHPSTPVTRDLNTDEARAALERDWLHQADQNPTPERIKSEIQWTRALIARLESQYPDKTDFAAALSELSEIETQAEAASAPDTKLYFKVRSVKRNVMLRNPVVDFTKVLFVDMPFPAGSEWPHETRHRLGYMAVPGARLLILDGLGPEGNLTQLMPQAPLHGSFWRPDVSFDAKKVVFCFKPHNEKSFHLYEINVDGSGFTQLTDGPYDDLDPVYLPDDQHILFCTTRGHNYVRCMPPTNSFELARCDRDGKNVYLVSYSNEPDYLPSVMDDGRVVYTRWEYTDKPLWRAQKLWTMNPDGTQVSTLWGNQSVWPDVMKDARSIPGSRRVMFTGSAHHNWFGGSVGMIDPVQGFNFPKGLTKITADVEWPECGNGPVDPIESPDYHASGQYPAYYSPCPLSEKDFLVSAQRNGKFLLYLMDVDGNRELVYEGENNILHAMPLKPRTKPPAIVDRVAWPTKEERENPKKGVLYSSNVYHGAPEELQGKAKYLRVMSIDSKTYTYWYKRPYISTGPVVSAVQSDGVKRIHGTVPIEKDGSVSFEAPSGTALHFQLLDENYRALQTMRSFVGVMPGERRGCLGCHESHSRAPAMDAKATALAKEPSTITPPPWKDNTVSYPRYVQPVLDQYCGKCHQGGGKAREVLDLTERPTSPILTEPYMTLIGRPSWGAPYKKPDKPVPGFGIANMIMVEAYGTLDPQAYVTPKPMTFLSYKSKLIDIASSGEHHGVKVDPINLQRLIVWVDAMCPYLGEEEIKQIPDPEFQGVDWLAVRPLVQNAPTITRPGPVD